jgi:hypothetical protein
VTSKVPSWNSCLMKLMNSGDEEMKGIVCENAKKLAQRLHKALETKHKRYHFKTVQPI